LLPVIPCERNLLEIMGYIAYACAL
jgi:hypothetical protein